MIANKQIKASIPHLRHKTTVLFELKHARETYWNAWWQNGWGWISCYELNAAIHCKSKSQPFQVSVPDLQSKGIHVHLLGKTWPRANWTCWYGKPVNLTSIYSRWFRGSAHFERDGRNRIGPHACIDFYQAQINWMELQSCYCTSSNFAYCVLLSSEYNRPQHKNLQVTLKPVWHSGLTV